MSAAALLAGRAVFAAAFLLVLLTPAWWAAGRLQGERTNPFFRLLAAIGLAIVAYLSIVNLIGRAAGDSIAAVWVCLGLSAAASACLLARRRAEMGIAPLLSTWRVWLGPVALAIAFGLPQWLVAISTNFWDEATASGIYLTAPNQFADGLFPPRHNALPAIPLKYHYGFTILSGTIEWLSGLSPNISTDLASTGLWLFVFLFVYFWLRDLAFDVLPSVWGAFATLLGGGLSWLYAGRLEAYSTGGYMKDPAPSDLAHGYDAAMSWLANVAAAATTPSQHLRNADGTLSNLPWDIAGQFQQHATALGIALTPVALYLLITWQRRKELHVPLLLANVVTFGVLPLAHAVFGSMAIGTAGVCLLWSWLRERTRLTFLKGLCFGIGVLILAPLHGGMLTPGAQYGAATAFATFRTTLGYANGGLSGFVNWNIAGFGLPLIFMLVAVAARLRRREPDAQERALLFTALVVFAGVSYAIPQVMFYSSESIGVEEFTEISKFFFSARFGLALLSVFGVAALARRVQRPLVPISMLMTAVTPVAFCYAHSVDPKGAWVGFYRSPYEFIGGRSNVEVQMGDALRGLRKSNHDVFFDASADETRLGYLSGLLIYSGSMFTTQPTGFERNGVGFRLSEQVVAERLVQTGRMARLTPGAPEEAGVTWYYARPDQDMALAPVIVRSRFAKLVREGYFVKRHQVGARAIYEIVRPTAGLDRDIERYWQPRVVAQMNADWTRDIRNDLPFSDLLGAHVRIDGQSVALPAVLRGEPATPSLATNFGGEARPNLIVGRLGDTVYTRGKSINDLQEYSPWLWSERDAVTGEWQPAYFRWQWDWDTPIVADLNHDGAAHHIAYRHRKDQWLEEPDKTMEGPVVKEADLPLPFAGRFLNGSVSDLGIWSLRNGLVSLRSVSNGKTAALPWGAQADDILVPGDYDGAGYDQIATYRRTTRTWRWQRVPDGAASEVVFGTDTAVPVPFDYNHDGRLDLAYWEPAQGKIFVSYDRGRTIGLVVPVPAHSIPAFVQMY